MINIAKVLDDCEVHMQLPQGDGWGKILEEVGQNAKVRQLLEYVAFEYQRAECYPPMNKIFRALELCPLGNVKVVIIGQDPYHNPSQADGLAFSCVLGKLPPSLRNIFKTMDIDCGASPTSGDLAHLASQGVLLINTCLTVRRNEPNSHAGQGWEVVTGAIIDAANARDNTVFLLWGEPSKRLLPEGRRRTANLYLEAPHPSPLSAYRGFFDCGHFKECNEYLVSRGIKPIDWAGGDKW